MCVIFLSYRCCWIKPCHQSNFFWGPLINHVQKASRVISSLGLIITSLKSYQGCFWGTTDLKNETRWQVRVIDGHVTGVDTWMKDMYTWTTEINIQMYKNGVDISFISRMRNGRVSIKSGRETLHRAEVSLKSDKYPHALVSHKKLLTKLSIALMYHPMGGSRHTKNHTCTPIQNRTLIIVSHGLYFSPHLQVASHTKNNSSLPHLCGGITKLVVPGCIIIINLM